jgi:hypothetical protein
MTGRKTIGETSKPPCLKCYNEGHNCVLAGSRRGGDHTHHRVARSESVRQRTRRRAAEPTSSSVGIQNPLEALELLAKVAAKENQESRQRASADASPLDERTGSENENTPANNDYSTNAHHTPSTTTGLEFLDPRALGPLLERYHDTYHAFLPLVPRHVLSTRDIARTATDEPFVLTAVLLIVTKDQTEYRALHRKLWEAMQHMLLQIVLGSMQVRTVGCVEGLLILAEWVPHVNTGQLNVSEKGTGGLAGSEDTAAWTLVGLAVRQAYLLHLDKYAFRSELVDENKTSLNRKRLVWTYTYIADRQISIRMGQAFWCRGPSLATKFTAVDFPSLQPHNAYEDDYACVLQAQLELTTLFGNIHDLLYASKPRSINLMLMGDYTKYLDDSMQGLAAWKQTWSHLDIVPHLKVVLELHFEYLRLYVHGFAFQAALSRAPSTPPNSGQERHTTRFANGLLATPDGRHIHLAISAARSVLQMLGERINPTKHLRFLGPRYYLYAIHCAVFLYKASSNGAITAEELKECVEIVQRYANNLDIAASCEQHIAARHSLLLTSLWLDKPSVSNSYQSTVTGADSGQNTQLCSGTISIPSLGHEQLHDLSHLDTGWGGQYSAHGSRLSAMVPESLVTGLYENQFDVTDPFSMLDFGAYGEPDLRNLISM